MKNIKLNAAQVWKQLEDLLVPQLHLSVFDRAVYSHLLRHSRLEGRLQLRFSILWLARGAGLSDWAARKAVRRLVAKGAVRLAERSRAGHVVQVRLPEEIRSVRAGKIAARASERRASVGRLLSAGHPASVGNLEETDFLETRALREAIHAREGGRCFYCLGRLTPMVRCLDHVVPRVRGGRNGYRNLVSSCAEFRGRLRAMARLAAGKLRPALRRSARNAQRALTSLRGGVWG
jgi:hypothetical protein